jgi:hypothetical protein
MSTIDTGGYYSGRGTTCEDSRPVQGENQVLFDPASTFLQSGLIIVRADQPVMLVAYMVPEGAEFVVEGVAVGSRAVQQGGGCCSPCGPTLMGQGAADIRFREPMTLGGNTWVINEAKKRLVINLPGTYLLVLNDDQYLGSVHVEMVKLGDVKTTLPTAYLAGIQV